MDQFTAARVTKTNIITTDSDEDDSETEEASQREQPFSPSSPSAESIANSSKHSLDDSKLGENPPPSKKPKEETETPLLSAKTKAKRDQAETYAWKNIGDVFAKKNKAKIEPKESKDAEAMFGDMIAEELRQFSGRSKAIVRHKIQNIIFEEQMKTFDQCPPSYRNPSSNLEQPRNVYGSPTNQPNQVQTTSQSYGRTYWTDMIENTS